MSDAYWEATREQVLLVQHCGTCGRAVWYPRTFCPHCGGRDLTSVPASGRGRVHTFTIEHRPAPPFGPEPYVVALVDMDEGIRMMGNIVGSDPGAVAVGDPVELTWQALDDGRHLAQWTPAP